MDFWHLLEENMGNGKHEFLENHRFTPGKTMVFKVRQVRQIARSFEEGTLVFH